MARIPTIGRKSAGQYSSRSGSRPEGARLIPVDCASAAARPNTIAETYLELEHEARGLEQQHLFAAEGELHARSQTATVKSLDHAAGQLKASVERTKLAADKAAERYECLRDTLGPYVQRKARSSIGYLARTGALLVGDIAGLSGAAITLGEYPTLAVTQAISAGTATVTAGLAATQLRHQQQATQRKRDNLPQVLEPYRHLFGGSSGPDRFRTAILSIATLIASCVSVGVFALRTAVEGSLSGLTFGALTAAIALASFINSWYHADAVADLIESARLDAHQTDRRHRHLSQPGLIGEAEKAGAQAHSLITEHTHRGLAAAAHLDAEKYRALQASPDVVGHGPASTQPESPVRRARSA